MVDRRTPLINLKTKNFDTVRREFLQRIVVLFVVLSLKAKSNK